MKAAPHEPSNVTPTSSAASFPVAALHLYTLSAFACAQPLFDILARHAEFFAVRRSLPVDLIALVFVLIVVLPLPLVAVSGLAGRIGERARGIAQATLIGLLFALLLMLPLSRSSGFDGAWVLVLALVLGTAAGVFYARQAQFRVLLSFASVALVAFPAIFLFDPGIRKVVFPAEPLAIRSADVGSATPIVLVVFDAFPTSSLLGADQAIDGEMFPHFAELAKSSIWFRNATTVSMNTVSAIPAILTGRYPRPDLHPTFRDHPENLFTLLQRDYQIQADERLTYLNASDDSPRPLAGERLRSLFADLWVIYLHLLLPPDWTGHLPPISQSWNNFAASDDPFLTSRTRVPPIKRSGQFLDFVERIDATTPRSLWFHHLVLPHSPYIFYPSGRPYSHSRKLPGRLGAQWGRWNDDEWATAQGYQRHLLQVGLVDSLVGQLIARLRHTGFWDTAIIVLTADHGASFRAGDGHRELTDTNFADILSVPLFVRAPGQERGQISDANVETIDILPSVAELLDVSLPWDVDGLSMFDGSIEQRAEKHCYREGVLTFAANSMEARNETAARKLDLFGESGPDRLFRLGPHGNLVGRPLRSFPPPAPATSAGRLNHPELFQNVSPESGFLPGEIVGVINRQPDLPLPWIAVAVNGVIQAVTRPYEDNSGRDTALWATVVPEHSFTPGRNRVELFIVERGREGTIDLRSVAPLTDRPDLRGITLGADPVWGVEEAGFWSRDSKGRAPYRWTNGHARLLVPVDPADPPHELVVELLTRRELTPKLEIVVNGDSLFVGSVTKTTGTITVGLGSVGNADQLKIELLSDTWVPMELNPKLRDKRQLGVAVKGVTLH